MSSKTEESSSRSVLRAFQHARISTKITAVYAVILFILLTVGIGAMAFGVYYAFYHQAEVAIGISERRTVEKLEGGADFTPNFWNDDPVLPGVVLRVTDITGRVVFENDAHFPSLADIDAHTRTRPPFWADQGMAVADVGNSTIYHATVDVMHGGSIYTLHFLRTITAESSFLKDMQRFLLLLTVSGFIIALCAGYFLSRSVLRPIRTMMATAREIEVEDMSRRIEASPAHDELHELAITFNHMLDRLQAGFNQQQRFVSDASHELRTPVTVILGYSDLLARWGQTDKDVLKEGISSIRSEAENMQQLIEKLLFLARADQKRQVLHKENIELSELVADVMRKMKLVTKQHAVELLENEPGTIYADPVMIRQLMRIFLENSMKYTPAGGHITAKCLRQGRVMLLSLGDDGIGIAPEEQQKVFERFYRVDMSRTKAEGVSGTGLGLSIATWIAEQHGIRITMNSALGKGTTIHLAIPCVDG
ncbi:MAG: ATP-binding protein [Selenomonadaceae bacterium]|nr:ATP-binding protein [Selenomonadaceae bacterium]